MSRREDQKHLLDLIEQGIAAVIPQTSFENQVGFVISGGLDSSTVMCLTRRAWPNRNNSRDHNPRDPGFVGSPTFTGYYADGPAYDERGYSHMVAGRDHHDVLITPDDFVLHFDAMIQAVRPPYQGPGTFGQYMVGRYIAKNTNVKVVLSGEGADELFGGYARTMLAAGEPPPDGYESYVPPADYPLNDLAAALQYDLDRLPLLLAVDDQCMAAHGLKAEAPFTDKAVVEFALNLPVTDRIGKRYLREAVRGVVPDAIIDRTDKRGFPAPFVKWAQTDPVKTFVADRIGYVPDPDRPWDRQWWLNSASAPGPGRRRQHE